MEDGEGARYGSKGVLDVLCYKYCKSCERLKDVTHWHTRIARDTNKIEDSIGKRKKGITQDHNKSQQIHGIHIQVMYANLLDLS